MCLAIPGKILTEDDLGFARTGRVQFGGIVRQVRLRDLGYPLAQITRLDFPEPPPMRSAPDLIAQGKSAEALAQLEPVVKYYEGFRDAPGSWWAPLIVLKIEALNSAGKEAEAASLTEQTLQLAKDPEAQRALRARQAANLARQGKTAEAEEICDTVIKESKDARTLAAAYLAKGQCLLAKKQWEDAMLAFLETPVFYPGEKVELPKSMLGIGRAQFGMDNFTEARAALNDLIKTYAASTEAMQAKTELDNIARREKALAAPK